MPGPPRAKSGPGGSWRIALGTALACLPLLALSQFTSHIRLDEFDSWLFAYYGKQITNGLVLYEQLWDNKPPGIFWINALATWLSGGSLTGMIVLCGLTVAATCVVFYKLTLRLYGPWTAAGGTVMAAVFLYQQFFHVGCNRPSTFFVLTELGALLLYVRAVTQAGTSWRALAAAGFVGGLGVWFKQSALAATAAMGMHQLLLILGRHQPARVGLTRAMSIAGGWLAAVILAGLIILLTSDAGWAWHAIVSFNRLYFLPEAGSRWWPQWFGLSEQTRVLALPIILALATLLYAAALRFRREPAGPGQVPAEAAHPPMWLALLWIWMAVATYLALVGPHKRLHYLGIALPPLCMLAAHGLHLFLATGRRVGGGFPSYYLFVGFVWCGYMMLTPLGDQLHALNRHYYYKFEALAPDSRTETGELIRRHTGPDDTMFVWGYAPEVYFRADRPPAIRYVGTEKAQQLGRAGQPLMDQIIAELKAARPKVLVISADRVTRFDEPRANDALSYGQFGAWLRSNYRLNDVDSGRRVWLRREVR